MEVKEELQHLNFMSDLSMENEKFKKIIKHFVENTARKYLVAILQDNGHFNTTIFENLCEGDADLQIKLTKEAIKKGRKESADSVREEED